MKDFICVIPARGGSKRLPRKNVMLLAGKPLLAHTIEVAIASGFFGKIVVSTDDEEILQLAEEYGVSTDKRPDQLGDDVSKAEEVVEEYLIRERVAASFHHVVMMLPTCPLRSIEDVKNGLGRYLMHDGDSYLISVTKYDFAPQLALQMDDVSHGLVMSEPVAYKQFTCSQAIPQMYHPNGALYVAPVPAFLQTRTFFSNPLVGYEMPVERSVDIDYLHQFEIAQSFLSVGSELLEYQ